MSLSKPSFVGAHLLPILLSYDRLLKSHPLIVKSVTSGITAAVGNIASQLIYSRWPFNRNTVFSFALTGLLITGPITHYFYLLLDKIVPADAPLASLKRLIIDRLIFGPPFLILTMYSLTRLEGRSHHLALSLLELGYPAALKMSLKLWTVFQYINLTYVPTPYRVLFANVVALIWNMYLSQKRRLANKRKK